MAGRNEIGVLYGAGLVRGVALVTFPAASSILTSPAYYGLTSTACGLLFLSLALGFGQQELTTIAAFPAGGLIAAYQIGHGLAAFGVGPLQDAGIELATIYRATAIVAVAMGLLSFVVVRGRRPALA